MSEGMPHLAERLDRLFVTVPRAVGEPLHTNESASDRLAQMGITVSAAHLGHLRTGRRDNPSARLLQGLARVFDVPVTYFYDEDVAREFSESLSSLASLRDEGVQAIMLRAQGLDQPNLDVVRSLLDNLRRVQGLEPPKTP